MAVSCRYVKLENPSTNAVLGDLHTATVVN